MKRLRHDILIALFALAALAPAAALSAAPSYSRDWSDLEERAEERTFGSEKVRRYPVDMFFIQYERWEAHRSLTILGLYRSTDYPRYTATRLWPFYDSITSKVDGRSRTWSWMGPVYYRKQDTGYDYLHLFPLYTSETYRQSDDRSLLYCIRWGGHGGERQSSYFTLFPLFFYDGFGRSDASNGWSVFLTPLLLYHDSSNRRYSNYSQGYHEKRLTISPLWVRSASRDFDSNGRIMASRLAWWAPIIPLVYYSSGPESWHFNGLWIYDMEHRPGRLFRWFFLPLWLYSDSTAGNMNATTSATVFHFYSHRSRREKNGPETTVERAWWAPIIPLYYSSYDETGGAHRNFLWLADWHTTPQGSLDRAWVMPLYWYREHRYHHLIPLWMSWRDASSFTGIGPLFLWGYHRDGQPEQGADYRFWTPAIPLVYHYSGRDGSSHTNALWLFDWAHGADGSLSHFWFLPLVAHNCGAGGYRQYLPFYVRPPGWTDERGVSFGLLHYHRWAPGEETLWWPLRYLRTDGARRERVSHWMPLYYSWENTELFGAPGASLTVFLPLYMNYSDRTRNIHVNLLGISTSSLRGPLAPDLMLSVGWRQGSWYLDSDVSWLYEMFSVSARTTIRNPFGEDEVQAPPPAQAQTAAPSLAARRESSRESSTEFFGWKALFGLLAWERADSVKHFRLLPLAWFTWDEASDDRVSHFFPAYFSYRSEQVEYFVLYPLLVPLYGMSRDGESTFRAFLITAFWSEYDASRHEREYTVLWPFFNWYSSPGRSGWRIFPLFWSKTARDGDSVTSSVISPLYYRSRRENTSEGAVRETVIAPFIYASSTRAGASFEQSVAFPIVPVFFYSRSEHAVTENGDPLARTSHFVLPLYYWRENTSGSDSDWVFIGLPLVYVHGWTSPGANDTTIQNRTVFALGCYTRTEGGVTHTNILGLFNWESDSSNGSVSRWLFPFFVKQGNDRDGYVSVPLLLSSYGWHGEARELFLAGLFWHRYDPASRERCLHLFPLLISRWRPDEYTLVLFGSYWHSSEQYSRWNLWYLLDHSSSGGGEESYWGVAFGMAQYERTRAMRRFRLALGILAEYERSMKTPRWHARVLWLGYERSGDGYEWNLLPALYHSSEPLETYTCVPLALQYYHRRVENVFHVVGAGAVYYYNRDAEERTCREMWLLGTLYNHVEKPARDLARDYRSSGSLWGLLWEYETESLNGVETWNQTSALFRLYRRVNDGGEVHHRILGISL